MCSLWQLIRALLELLLPFWLAAAAIVGCTQTIPVQQPQQSHEAVQQQYQTNLRQGDLNPPDFMNETRQRENTAGTHPG
jgi:hypothetical protein